MKCKKLDTCTFEISSFVYAKACQGNFKFAYCPRHQTKDVRVPSEWAEFYQSSAPTVRNKDE